MPIKRPKAKAKKRTAKKVRQNWCQMVIRVRVPVKNMREGMRLHAVRALDKGGWLQELEVLSAYYDIAGQPDATPQPP